MTAKDATKNDTIRRNRQTRIVATLGPASSTPEMIEKLFLTGVDVFRLNFSHGSHEDHHARYKAIRAVEEKYGRPIGIMADLQGPKLRVGQFANGSIEVSPGQHFRFDLDPAPGDATRVQLPHPEIFASVVPGSEILMDDGKVRMRVLKTGKDFFEAECMAGKKLSNNKGVNLPNVMLKLSPLTEKDRKDLEYAVSIGVDWIALSFVQRPEDVAEARKAIAGRASLITKLEKPSALQHLDRLIEMSDAVMVARGDLGVEIPAEKVPGVQKHIVRTAREAGKPVIIATQMLESMITSPTPTRAEASDVATAVYDGTDAVMLSAETAAGEYPLEAVSIMDRIAAGAEQDRLYRKIMDAEHPDPDKTASDAITSASSWVAHTVSASAIANFTTSGSTTLRTARERPSVPILCMTASMNVARRLVMSYGVYAVHTKDIQDFQEMTEKATRVAFEHGLAKKGERIVITAGVPFGTPGSTNILRIAWVEGK